MRTTLTRNTEFRAISVDEAKLWCRIDDDTDDLLVDGLILAATEAAEAFTDRFIAPATVELAYDARGRSYRLETAPVQSVTGVELEDQSGTRTTVSILDGIFIRQADIGPTVVLSTAPTCGQLVIVTAEVGYASAEAVPQAIKQAIAVHVGSAYAGREGQDTAQATFENLLRPFRVGGF